MVICISQYDWCFLYAMGKAINYRPLVVSFKYSTRHTQSGCGYINKIDHEKANNDGIGNQAITYNALIKAVDAYIAKTENNF